MDSLPWDLALTVWAAAALLQQGLWFVQRRLRDAGVVDVGWAASLAGAAVFYALQADGAPAQRLAVGLVGGLWGLRLASHLLVDRVLGHDEDGRYAALRQHWGARADRHFVWVFQAQALLAALLSLPFLIAAGNPAPALAPVQLAGLGLFVLAKLGETVADRQLARFRADPSHRGRTCRVGLWRVSRHPNYFCEWLVWCAFAALAWPAPVGALALLAPALMYLLITRVTGIPHTEAQALRSRGDDYRRYQRTTSPLIPWFPRPDPEDAADPAPAASARPEPDTQHARAGAASSANSQPTLGARPHDSAQHDRADAALTPTTGRPHGAALLEHDR